MVTRDPHPFTLAAAVLAVLALAFSVAAALHVLATVPAPQPTQPAHHHDRK